MVGVLIGAGIFLILLGSVLLVIARKDASAKARWGKIGLELPTGALFVLVGAAMVGFPVWAAVNNHTATPTPAVAVGPAPPTTDPPTSMATTTTVPPTTAPKTTTTTVVARAKAVEISSPHAGALISGRAGVVVTGTAVGLGADTLWVFDYDEETRLYYRDTDEPLRVHNGRWSFLDQPIGETGTGDVGATFTIAVVRASPTCARTLRNKPPNAEGDITFGHFPAGCSEADSVDVVKNRA
jgi:hypothetical protein